MSAAQKGRIIPAETRARMSGSAKGRKMAPDVIAKRSATRIGSVCETPDPASAISIRSDESGNRDTRMSSWAVSFRFASTFVASPALFASRIRS